MKTPSLLCPSKHTKTKVSENDDVIQVDSTCLEESRLKASANK